MSTPAWFDACYAKAEELALKRWPYVFGGGHTVDFEPSFGIAPQVDGIGYDCSGFDSAIVHAGCPGELRRPLATHEIERWGFPGIGEWMTWWVANRIINGIPTEHCVQIGRAHV